MTDMPMPRFSVCIPNYNYAHYLGETLDALRAQTLEDFEVCVADNASTDDSVDVIARYEDARFKVSVNRWNVGFAGNLDKAARLAEGEHMIMLSSDDLIAPEALATYDAVLRALPAGTEAQSVLASRVDVVDSESVKTGSLDLERKLWRDAERDPALSDAAGADVYAVSTRALLRRSLELMRNPLPFLATCYPRRAWEDVEGYGGGRQINPDKFFSWKLLSATTTAYFIDRPLFSYRWHAQNQSAQQKKSATLKHLVDEYLNTFDVAPQVLAHAGLERDDLIEAFVEHDIALRNLRSLAEGDVELARRGLLFGRAAYPRETRRSWKVGVLRGLLALGPAGTTVARFASGPARRAWERRLAG